MPDGALEPLFLQPLSTERDSPTDSGYMDCGTDSVDWYTEIVGETPCMSFILRMVMSHLS